MKLMMHEIPIEQFTFDKGRKMLMAEASDLPTDAISRVFDDACDVGVKIKGRTMTRIFVLERTKQRDGEIEAWYFKILTPSELFDAETVQFVVVFND